MRTKEDRAATVGRNLLKLRRAANLTQKEVAKALGSTQAVVSIIERGSRDCPLATAEDLARLFDVDPGDILFREAVLRVEWRKPTDQMVWGTAVC